MSTSGWVVAVLFGFGVLFWLWSDRAVTERQAQTGADVAAESARLDADFERIRTGKRDPALEQRAADARAKADAVAKRGEALAKEREIGERAIEHKVSDAIGLPTPGAAPAPAPAPATPAPQSRN